MIDRSAAAMNKTDNLHFLAFTTTGPLAEDDCVVETAVLRVEDGRENGYVSLVTDPDAAPVTTRISAGDGEPPPATREAPGGALQHTLAELGEHPTVAHDAATLLEFIEYQYLLPPRRLIDTLELARIVLPLCPDHSLAAVANELGIEPPEDRSCVARARLTHRVWERLIERACELPPPALAVLSELGPAGESATADIFAEAACECTKFTLSDAEEPELDTIFRSHERIFLAAQQYQAPEPVEKPLDTEKICAMFEGTGAVGRNLANFETRREQIQMAESVCVALNHGRHLLCEAGTGIGKSMAYLLPMIAWARQNEDKVIVSTNTKNLQEQLYGKDLPFLKKLLGGRFSTALLKGRRNYLCVRKFLNLIRYRNRELSEPDEFAALMPLVSWAATTETGDLSECAGFAVHRSAFSLMSLITAAGDECLGKACTFASRCFVRRARSLALLSDVTVVNHALVFADAAIDSPYLPHKRCIVFDEAHNIEDAATEAASITADGLSFYRVCRRLWREHKDGSGTGMLPSLMEMAGSSFPEAGPLSRIDAIELARHAVEAVGELSSAVRDFFDGLSAPFEPLPPAEDKILLDRCRPEISETGEIGDGAAAVLRSCRSLQKRIKDLIECMEVNEDSVKKAAEFSVDLTAQINRLKEAAGALEFVLKREGEGHVYWLQRSGRGGRRFHAIHAAPLDVGDFMRTFFFDEMRSVIMTSATLRVDGKFDYIKERLGAGAFDDGRLACAAFGSPFDFRSQAMLCVPTFLPDAGGRRDSAFDEELSSFLIDLLRGTNGRSLVLFTSYSLLNTVYERIKRPLTSVGIPLLAQGKDGSRQILTALFQQRINSVLLGTQSFWEGVDVLGESLSCLVVTKLPFHVFTDPLVEGRSRRLRELGSNPFSHYTLPEAVISFRQGFGRLIRHRNDRGAVVVTDRRLVTKPYGRSFLSDLDTPHRVYKSRETLIAEVKDFLNRPAQDG